MSGSGSFLFCHSVFGENLSFCGFAPTLENGSKRLPVLFIGFLDDSQTKVGRFVTTAIKNMDILFKISSCTEEDGDFVRLLFSS